MATVEVRSQLTYFLLSFLANVKFQLTDAEI